MEYPVIDSDGHVMERPELFEEYLEPPYRPPRVLVDQETRTRYWLIEGKLVSRPQGPGMGTSIGFIDHPKHPVLGSKMLKMLAKDNGPLEDIPGLPKKENVFFPGYVKSGSPGSFYMPPTILTRTPDFPIRSVTSRPAKTSATNKKDGSWVATAWTTTDRHSIAVDRRPFNSNSGPNARPRAWKL